MQKAWGGIASASTDPAAGPELNTVRYAKSAVILLVDWLVKFTTWVSNPSSYQKGPSLKPGRQRNQTTCKYQRPLPSIVVIVRNGRNLFISPLHSPHLDTSWNRFGNCFDLKAKYAEARKRRLNCARVTSTISTKSEIKLLVELIPTDER